MQPWQIARQIYESNSTDPFELLLGSYLAQGILHSSPEIFILARPVHYQATEIQAPDAWFVHLAASAPAQRNSIREFMRMMPFPLPYVLWQRSLGRPGQHFHAYPWDQLARRVGFYQFSGLTSVPSQ